MKRLLFLVAVAFMTVVLLCPVSGAAQLLPPTAKPMQMDYKLWTVTWMRAAFKRTPQAPTSLLMLRGNKCGFAFGKMWLLPDLWVGPQVPLSVETRCTIPRGKLLFVPIAWTPGPGRRDFINAIPAILSTFAQRSLTVDGRSLRPGYFVRTPVFTLVLPRNNVFAPFFGSPPGPATAVAAGYFAILSPLPTGKHVVTTFARYVEPDLQGAVTFRLTVR